MEFTQQIAEIVAFVESSLAAGATHWDACRLTADKFDLWENDHFPLWLSFVVAGQMREMGIEG